ncbi:hypothetical protein V6N12_020656 [Hibiscus sabdariffa]|uniref:Uncharacterized protein n=1 Tax=Hibiscus sabdariffa TaxID=183260 RepID=A0ABR2CYQ9_9ROSI
MSLGDSPVLQNGCASSRDVTCEVTTPPEHIAASTSAAEVDDTTVPKTENENAAWGVDSFNDADTNSLPTAVETGNASPITQVAGTDEIPWVEPTVQP